MHPWSRRATLVALALLLGGPPAAAEPRALAVDREASSLVAVTGLSGLLSFLGHRHAVLATAWTADLVYDEGAPGRSRVALEVEVRALAIDSPPAIAAAGLGGRPDDETVRTLQAKLLGPAVLDAGRFPAIRFESRSVERAGDDRLLVRGALALRGRTSEHTVPVAIERGAGGVYRFRGQLSISQRAHGIEPESVAGVVKVTDAVEIRFDVHARAPSP